MTRLTILSLVIAALSVAVAILALTMALSFALNQGVVANVRQEPSPTVASAGALPAAGAAMPTTTPGSESARVSPNPTAPPMTLVPAPTPPKDVVDYALLATRDICLAEKCDNQAIARAGRKSLLSADVAAGISESWCLAIQYDSHGCFEERKALVVNVRRVKEKWELVQFNSWEFDKCLSPGQ